MTNLTLKIVTLGLEHVQRSVQHLRGLVLRIRIKIRIKIIKLCDNYNAFQFCKFILRKASWTEINSKCSILNIHDSNNKRIWLEMKVKYIMVKITIMVEMNLMSYNTENFGKYWVKLT